MQGIPGFTNGQGRADRRPERPSPSPTPPDVPDVRPNWRDSPGAERMGIRPDSLTSGGRRDRPRPR